MELNDFSNYLEEKKFEEIQNKIESQFFELIEKIFSKKSIKLSSKGNKLDQILEMRDKISVYCRVAFLPVDKFLGLMEDNYEYVIKTIPEVQDYINKYNKAEKCLKRYIKIENEIREKGFETVLQKRIDKLLKLFKEMFEYKRKKYDETLSFKQQIEKLYVYYHSYNTQYDAIISALENGYVRYSKKYKKCPVDDVEKIIVLENAYNVISNPEYNYKEEAYLYREFELKEGQTYEGLYELELEKITILFKEMLNYKGIIYNEEDDLFTLRHVVARAYPFLAGSVNMIISRNDDDETYIQCLDIMEDLYEDLKMHYKEE